MLFDFATLLLRSSGIDASLIRAEVITYETFNLAFDGTLRKIISLRASLTTCVVALTTISARIFLRSSTVEFREIANLYSASKKVNLDSEIAELNEEDLRPSDRRELSAEPTKEITPRESKTVERITLVDNECDNALRMPFMECEPRLRWAARLIANATNSHNNLRMFRIMFNL